jgi:hypothetical protein
MNGTDYAQTRIKAIEGLTTRIATLENSPAHRWAAEAKLAELKQEAKVFLLDGGHPRSEWSAKLEELTTDDKPVAQRSTLQYNGGTPVHVTDKADNA